MHNHSTPIKAVFFDLGHTLIYFNGDFDKISADSYGILADTLIKAGCHIDRQAFTDLFDKRMKNYYAQREIDFIERPIEKIIKDVMVEIGQDHFAGSLYTEAMHEMYRATERHWIIEEDTHSTLRELLDEHYLLALISNASNAWDVNNLIDDHQLRPYFNPILISAEEGIRKPDIRIFQQAAQKLGIEPAEAVMVGDLLDADILGAHRAGMRAIWISRRAEPLPAAQPIDPQMQPDAEIGTLAELPNLLAQWNR